MSTTSQVTHVTGGTVATNTVSRQCLLLASPLWESWVCIGLVRCNKLGCVLIFWNGIHVVVFNRLLCSYCKVLENFLYQ